MITFGFGTFRPKADIQPILTMLAQQLNNEFGVNAVIRKLDEISEQPADLVLIDVSRQLHSLHVSGLGKIHRLFVLQAGPTKVSQGLQQFFQSLSKLHGKPVQFIYDQKRIDESVYQIDALLKHTAVGFHMGESTTPSDLNELASALFQEYYALRIDQMKNQRIEHIISNLAMQALEVTQVDMAHAEMAATSSALDADTALSGKPRSGSAEAIPGVMAGTTRGIPDAAQTFLSHVLESLDVPYRVKYLFFRYVTLRIAMGQSLQEAVTDILPIVMENNAFEELSRELHMELEVHSLFTARR